MEEKEPEFSSPRRKLMEAKRQDAIIEEDVSKACTIESLITKNSYRFTLSPG